MTFACRPRRDGILRDISLKPKYQTGDDRNMPTRKGNKAIVIYYSPEEWEIICKKANAAKLRNGTYIRRMSVKGEIKYYELKELMSLKRAFLSIGNNLNQIAEIANSTGSIYQKDIEDMQEEFKYFRSAMNHYTFEISPTLIH